VCVTVNQVGINMCMSQAHVYDYMINKLKLCAAIVDTAVCEAAFLKSKPSHFINKVCVLRNTFFPFCMIENNIYLGSFYTCGTEPAPNPLVVVPLRWY
jgi:hypothetical protein